MIYVKMFIGVDNLSRPPDIPEQPQGHSQYNHGCSYTCISAGSCIERQGCAVSTFATRAVDYPQMRSQSFALLNCYSCLCTCGTIDLLFVGCIGIWDRNGSRRSQGHFCVRAGSNTWSPIFWLHRIPCGVCEFHDRGCFDTQIIAR